MRVVLDAALLGSGESVLVTKRGRALGVFVPLDEPERLANGLRRALAAMLGRHLNDALQRKGITQEEIIEDFHSHRRRRR